MVRESNPVTLGAQHRITSAVPNFTCFSNSKCCRLVFSILRTQNLSALFALACNDNSLLSLLTSSTFTSASSLSPLVTVFLSVLSSRSPKAFNSSEFRLASHLEPHTSPAFLFPRVLPILPAEHTNYSFLIFPTTIPRDNEGRMTGLEGTTSHLRMSDPPELNHGMGNPTEALSSVAFGVIRPFPEN